MFPLLPQLQVADLVLSELTQLAIKVLATLSVLWVAFAELLHEISRFRMTLRTEAAHGRSNGQ